jgi:hypothetical protein
MLHTLQDDISNGVTNSQIFFPVFPHGVVMKINSLLKIL